MAKKLPKEILVFEEQERDGTTYLVAVRKVDDIAEDNDGATVGVYVLKGTRKFTVRREMK